MKTLKITICAVFVVCCGLLFSACGSKNKNFEVDKINVNAYSEYTYDGKPHAVTVSYTGMNVDVKYALKEDKDNFKSVNDLGLIDVGTYELYYRISAKGFNSYTSTGTLELTILPKTITVTMQDQVLMKSELKNVFSLAYSVDGVAAGDEVDISYDFENYDAETANYGDVYNVVWTMDDSNYILNAPQAKIYIKEYFQLNDSEGNLKSYHSKIEDAISNAENGDIIVLNKNFIANKAITVDKSITIDGQGKYGITASAAFASSTYEDVNVKSILNVTDSAELKLKDVVVNGGQTARSISVLNGKLVVDNAKITGGKRNDNLHSAGVYVASGCGFEMTSGSILGNDSNDSEYTKYGADVWIETNEESGLVSISGGEVGNVFVKSTDNSGKLTLDGGKVANVYVEYNDNKCGAFDFKLGEVQHLFVALKNDNGSFAGVNHELTAVKNTTYFGGQLVYEESETTFANKIFNTNPAESFVDGMNYIFEGCYFAVPFEIKNEVGIVFNGCVFNSESETCLYVGKADSLVVNNCLFTGTTTGGYAIDINLYSSSCDDIIIANNIFDTTSADSNGAIAVKTRLGETDYPTDSWAQGQVIGFINGVVGIYGNDFNEDNKVIQFGTNPQGSSTAANISTGNFKAVVKGNLDVLTIFNMFKMTSSTQENEMFDKKIKISIAVDGVYDSTK